MTKEELRKKIDDITFGSLIDRELDSIEALCEEYAREILIDVKSFVNNVSSERMIGDTKFEPTVLEGQIINFIDSKLTELEKGEEKNEKI